MDAHLGGVQRAADRVDAGAGAEELIAEPAILLAQRLEVDGLLLRCVSLVGFALGIGVVALGALALVLVGRIVRLG